jgi:uncharacterized OB-fold protein
MSAIPVDEGLFSWPERPRLIASTCAACGTTVFPSQPSCPRCTGTQLRTVSLATTGRLWTWTIQAFEPKPPYTADGPFEPYGVGYVELAAEDGSGAVLVESRLASADPDRLEIGLEMTLVFVPFRRDDTGADVVTFAFEPVSPAAPDSAQPR